MSDKNFMDEENTFKVWTFPPISQNEPAQMAQALASEEEIILSSLSNFNDPHSSESSLSDQESLDLKNQLESQIKLVQEIQNQIQTRLAEIDESLLLQIITCLKKIILKIIKRELVINHGTINNMIKATLQDISPHSNCQIYLSSDDFQHLQAEQFNISAQFHEDANLSTGDFKISTSTGEIIALLEERINQLFELPK